MNIYAPYRYNKDTGKYEPELYPTLAPFVFMPDGSSLLDEIKDLKDRLDAAEDDIKDANKALGEVTFDMLIIQPDEPVGDAKKLWIDSANSVAYYYDGTDWKPVAGTAV